MESNANEFVMMMVVMPVMFLSVAWMVREVGRYLLIRKAMNQNAQLQSKLLDKYPSAPEVLSFLESDAGRSSMALPVMSNKSPHGRILGALQSGIVLSLLGIAFIALDSQATQIGEGFGIIGALILALGLGFVASGVVSYLLSKAWGLISLPQPKEDDSL